MRGGWKIEGARVGQGGGADGVPIGRMGPCAPGGRCASCRWSRRRRANASRRAGSSDVARPDLHHGPPTAHPAGARGHDQHLAERVRVPARNGRPARMTLPPDMRDGAFAGNSGSTRTEPVKRSAGPLAEGCDPGRVTRSVARSSLGPDDAAPGAGAADVLLRMGARRSSTNATMARVASRFHCCPPVEAHRRRGLFGQAVREACCSRGGPRRRPSRPGQPRRRWATRRRRRDA